MGSFRHSILPGAAALLLAVGCCKADDPKPAAAPPPPAVPASATVAGEMTADDVLDALDKRGQDLKGFSAKVMLKEEDTTLQNPSTRTGRIWFQKKSAEDGRIRVLFEKLWNETSKTEVEEKLEYLLDNGWLTDRNYPKRTEVRRQILRQGEKQNVLRLGEGPFPLPIGQKKEDVKKLFTVTKIKADNQDPAGTTHVRLEPIKGTDFAKKFRSVDVWMDLKNQMPVRIETLDSKGRDSKITEFKDVQVNTGVADGDFTLEKVPVDKWNIIEEPFGK